MRRSTVNADTVTERRSPGRRPATSLLAWSALVVATSLAACSAREPAPGSADDPEGVFYVRATVQSRPGAEHEEMDMKVFPAPVDLPTRAAEEVDMDDDELVLGVVIDGEAVAYPVRYLALSEVANDWVGETAIAPSW